MRILLVMAMFSSLFFIINVSVLFGLFTSHSNNELKDSITGINEPDDNNVVGVVDDPTPRDNTTKNVTSTETSETTNHQSWEELEKRIIPNWYDESKIGIFIHYGVFSVPSYKSEWFQKYWYGDHISDYVDYVDRTEQHSGETFSYTQYASRLSAIHYDPYQWSDIFAKSGAQYVVLTSKHHDGYCKFWNVSCRFMFLLLMFCCFTIRYSL